jgi:hypothetical protein
MRTVNPSSLLFTGSQLNFLRLIGRELSHMGKSLGLLCLMRQYQEIFYCAKAPDIAKMLAKNAGTALCSIARSRNSRQFADEYLRDIATNFKHILEN